MQLMNTRLWLDYSRSECLSNRSHRMSNTLKDNTIQKICLNWIYV